MRALAGRPWEDEYPCEQRGEEIGTVIKPPFAAIGACGWQAGLYALVSEEVFIVGLVFAETTACACVADDFSSLAIELCFHGVFLLFIYSLNNDLECSIHGTVVGESKRSSIVMYLPDIVTFAKHTITPCRYTCLFGRIVGIGVEVVFVGRWECDACFRVVWEGQASNHLQIELCMLELEQTPA
jgi:hypothetical protein